MLQNSTQEHQQEEAAAQTVATAAPISVDCDASVQTGTKPVKDKIEGTIGIFHISSKLFVMYVQDSDRPSCTPISFQFVSLFS